MAQNSAKNLSNNNKNNPLRGVHNTMVVLVVPQIRLLKTAAVMFIKYFKFKFSRLRSD